MDNKQKNSSKNLQRQQVQQGKNTAQKKNPGQNESRKI